MSVPRGDYPRPDRVRPNWMTLNGEWDFAFDPSDEGLSAGWHRSGTFPEKIQVPFCYQAPLSGIGSDQHCDVVWYQRSFAVPEALRGGRVLLHFGAADYVCQVWLNGQLLGSHEGGYTPFTFDITDWAAEKEKTLTLTVRCEDTLETWQPRGKQSWHPDPFACWYTPVTGLWQSVWLEGVGSCYPTDFRLTPDIDRRQLRAEVNLNKVPANGRLRFIVTWKGEPVTCQEVDVNSRLVETSIVITSNDDTNPIRLWAPEHPDLYDLAIETLSAGEVIDRVETYFGMREIKIRGDQIYLNRDRLFQRLVLDQGYWRDGLLTPPSSDALRQDVEMTLSMGYNGARKHQKVEDPWYLYWADHLGLLVWSELPSAYHLSDLEKRNLMRDMGESIRRDYNHPCIITWTPLNESWGVSGIAEDPEAQRLADALYALIHTLDATRPVSGNDGWEQAATDLVTVHDYTAWPEQLSAAYQHPENIHKVSPSNKAISAEGYDHAGKPRLLTEFGGIAFAADAKGPAWGYNGAVADEEAFLTRYGAITKAFREMPGFCGYCYTQLTDVFQEVNGLADMERKPKADVAAIRKANTGLDA